MEVTESEADNARIALQLQLSDIEEVLLNTTDEDQAAALRIQHEELINFNNLTLGRRVQQSMYQAQLADCGEIDAILGPETTSPDYQDDRMDSKGGTDLAEYMERVRLDEENPPRECYICMVDVKYSQTTEVGDCNHVWCRTCLTEMFDLAAKNESNYPIRCCASTTAMALDLPGVVSLVGRAAISAIQAKVVEYGTEDKTYCHEPRCSAFIAPDTINERQATCGACQQNTCAQCKAEYHEDKCDRANDEAFEQWRQDNEAATCNVCHRVIIISHGCNHMRYVFLSSIR